MACIIIYIRATALIVILQERKHGVLCWRNNRISQTGMQRLYGCMAVCHLTCLSNVSVPLTIHDMIMYISLVHTIHVF